MKCGRGTIEWSCRTASAALQQLDADLEPPDATKHLLGYEHSGANRRSSSNVMAHLDTVPLDLASRKVVVVFCLDPPYGGRLCVPCVHIS